jgi:hypothetical protein
MSRPFLERLGVKHQGARLGFLNDHKLSFKFIKNWEDYGCTGVANVLKSFNDKVYGVLYLGIDQQGQSKLDEFYRKIQYKRRDSVTIRAEGRIYFAFLYEAEDPYPTSKPSTFYKEYMVDGAVYWGLPIFYLEFLKKLETLN